MEKGDKVKQRFAYIDVLRIMSAVFVMYIHGSAYHDWENMNMPPLERTVYMVIAIITTCAVPIFMMLSGSLLIPKDESLKDLYKKRVSRVLLVILFITIICLVKDYIYTHTINFSRIFYDFLNLSARRSIIFWYLYWWLAFVIALPFYRKFAKSMDRGLYKYLFVLVIIFNIALPSINALLNHFGIAPINLAKEFSITILSNSIFYPLAGYYVDHVMDNTKVSFGRCLSTLVLAIAITALFNYIDMRENGRIVLFGGFSPIITISLYLTIKELFKNYNNEKVMKVISFVSAQTLCIYLLHVFIPDSFSIALSNMISPHFGVLVYKIVNFVLKFLIVMTISAILKLFKPFKKIL